ncbi:ATPase component of heat shock protein Hsp90 chaperone complex [Saccharomyces cerevisiae]|nr:ATPase component of heat shock protein Hsp90 chaperone complex [Saccharomyces boulardii (nom. inval.)]
MAASYTDITQLPPNTPEQIANWEITGVQLPEGQDSVPVKLKLRCDPLVYTQLKRLTLLKILKLKNLFHYQKMLQKMLSKNLRRLLKL